MRPTMAGANEFSMSVKQGKEAIRVLLRGKITEIVELDAGQVPGGRPIVIDAGGVTNLNSLGVRNWVRFLDALCAKSPNVVLQRFSPMLVFQASMISIFLSRARVMSFLSPWCCVECDHTLELEHAINDEIPQSVPCPKCKSPMEFDSDLDAYQTFRQLATQQR
jgi:hypothetical protein